MEKKELKKIIKENNEFCKKNLLFLQNMPIIDKFIKSLKENKNFDLAVLFPNIGIIEIDDIYVGVDESGEIAFSNEINFLKGKKITRLELTAKQKFIKLLKNNQNEILNNFEHYLKTLIESEKKYNFLIKNQYNFN